MIHIRPDKKTLAHLAALDSAQRGLRLALDHFAQSIARTVADEVQSRGRSVLAYDNLDVVSLGSDGHYRVAALVLPESMRRIEPDEADLMVAFVRSAPDTDSGRVLVRYSPWPAKMLPPSDELGLVVRKVEPHEIEHHIDRLLQAPDAVAYLRSVGVLPAGVPSRAYRQIVMDRSAPSLLASEDLAWKALRAEYGINGPSIPHWRPALRVARSPDKDLLEAFWTALIAGAGPVKTGMKININGIEKFQDLLGSPPSGR